MTTTDLIENFFPRYPYRRSYSPSVGHLNVDISETEKNFVVKADVPGIDKDDLDVQFHDNVLTISATAESEGKSDEGGKQRTLHQERFTGSYNRSFKFGKEVDKDSVNAKLNDGVLTVTISKRDPKVTKSERTVSID